MTISQPYRLLSVLTVLVLLIIGPGRAGTLGGTITVCPEGCDYSKIQAAIDAAQPGDTIEVQAGTYRENLVIQKPLALRGVGPDRVTIDGGAAGAEIPATTIEILASGVTVTGFTITNTRPELQPVGVWINSGDIHLQGNRIVDLDLGVEVIGHGKEVEIAGNEISNCKGGVGILSPDNPLIVGNVITGCDVGILLGFLPGEGLGGETGATISNNTISRNRFGIASYGAIADISHNLIEENSGPGIVSLFGSSSWTVTGNTIRGNGGEGIRLLGDDIAILLQNTVVENGADGIILAVKFAQVAGNSILANRGNGISVLSPQCEDAIGVIIGTHVLPPSYVHANEIKDNEGYGLFAEDATLVLMCFGDEISGNGLGDFSENLKDKCRKAEE